MVKTLKEAAEFLERTDRAVERYISQGKLSAFKEWRTSADGKKRQVLLFDDSDLERFKREMEAPKVRPKVEPRTVAGHKVIEEALVSLVVPTRDEQTDIARSGALFPRLVDAVETLAKERRQSSVKLRDKMMLSFAEASSLSGISVKALRAAVGDGRLSVVKGVGRGSKIKREVLEAFVHSL